MKPILINIAKKQHTNKYLLAFSISVVCVIVTKIDNKINIYFTLLINSLYFNYIIFLWYSIFIKLHEIHLYKSLRKILEKILYFIIELMRKFKEV